MKDNIRKAQISAFLRAEGIEDAPKWLPADASIRRYARIGDVILMDAPPHPSTRTHEYITITQFLRSHGIMAAEIIAQDPNLGLLLLQDLGKQTFSQHLGQSPEQAEELYDLAYRMLEHLQHQVQKNPKICPDYDTEVMRQELFLFSNWYCPALGINVSKRAWQDFFCLVEYSHAAVRLLPQRFVLRDCHMDNFILGSDFKDHGDLARCGVLDFQDGGWGSALYDVTSLLYDARRDVPKNIQNTLLRRHADFLGQDWNIYRTAASYLILQRALKVLGIFVRLNVRDHKPQYLCHLERCWRHVDEALEYLPEWQAWFSEHIPAHQRRVDQVLSATTVDTAMLLAAGKGTRMGPLGRQTPKPLLPIAGTPMIARTQNTLRQNGIQRFIVNAHHLSEHVRALYTSSSDTQVMYEDTLLETGGGVRHALSKIARENFWVINGDCLWQGMRKNELNSYSSIFHKIAQSSDFKTYKNCGAMLLLLVPLQNWYGAEPKADFIFCAQDRYQIRRVEPEDQGGFGFSGVRLMNRAAIAHEPIEKFSMNRTFDRLIATRRLFGLVVDWKFYHIGNQEALQMADRDFEEET